MSRTVKVHLLGRDYLLRSQGDPDQIQQAAILVEEKLAGLADSVSVDTRDRIILAMLNLAGEHLQDLRKLESLEMKLQGLREERTAADERLAVFETELIGRIEQALDT